MRIRISSGNTLAVLCLLFSAGMWGLIWYPVRLLNEAGMPGIWSSLVMYLAAAIVVLPFLSNSYHEIIENKGALLVLAIAAGVTTVAFVVALIEGEIMRVMLLFYLVMVLLLLEKDVMIVFSLFFGPRWNVVCLMMRQSLAQFYSTPLSLSHHQTADCRRCQAFEILFKSVGWRRSAFLLLTRSCGE